MKAEDCEATDRINRLIQEITDRDWLEAGMSQEELDQSRLITQQMNAALADGYSMDEVLRMYDCMPSEEPFAQEEPVDNSASPMPTQTDTGNNLARESRLPPLIEAPTVMKAAGNKPKRIEEYVGRVNSQTAAVSVARMVSPAGWIEPGQTPEFDEYTVVLRGLLQVTTRAGVLNVRAGQAVIAHRGEWVQYSSPEAEGAEYIAVCLPAFSPNSVHRDA